MEGGESKAESQGQDSGNTSQDVEGFQQYVEEILTLIEEDEIFSEIAPGIYDCKKAKLTKLVTKLSRKFKEHISTSPISSKKGSKSSFTTSSDSESLPDSPSKVEKARLLKEISNLEEEQLSLKKQIKELKDQNALLEAEISESTRKIETVRKALGKQVLAAAEEEDLEPQQDLSTGEKIEAALEEEFDEEEGRDPKLEEKVSLGLAEMAKRDEEMKELRSELKENWNSDIERLRSELGEHRELIDDLKQKHDAVMSSSYTDELKLTFII